jgi:hypothetical protein
LIDVDLAPEVLTALRAMKDRGTPPEYTGHGETKTVWRYQWTDGDRSFLAEEVKTEIFDGATPYSTYVRGVIIDGDRGVSC